MDPSVKKCYWAAKIGLLLYFAIHFRNPSEIDDFLGVGAAFEVQFYNVVANHCTIHTEAKQK